MTTQTQSKWAIDPAHSEIQFKVKHLVISTVTGYFRNFEGSVESTNDDFEGARIRFSADVNSIDTNNEQRDGHLKSDDFFGAAQFPKLLFASTSFKKRSGEAYELKGTITLKGVSKEITLAAELGGKAVDPYGNQKAGFEINGKLNRKDFGLNWDAVTEAGGIVVSDEVRLHINVQINKQA
ncbi:MAG: YceI family protein [Bacteroidia bacterium]